LKCQIRHVAASYNADHRQLFQADHLEQLRERPELTEADRFILAESVSDHEQALQRLRAAQKELKRFGQKGAAAEQARREILRSVPGVSWATASVLVL
jgi:hypothetical protein